jgi:general secretion pathway protein G
MPNPSTMKHSGLQAFRPKAEGSGHSGWAPLHRFRPAADGLPTSFSASGGYRFRLRVRLVRIRRAMTAPKRALAGFTLIELMVTIAVIGILAGIGLTSYMNSIDQAKITKAVADIAVLEKDIITFYLVNKRYPDNLAEIERDTFLDPYGNPYAYLNIETATGKGDMRKDHFLVPLNTDFDLYSMGKDGTSKPPLTANSSHDDILRANNGEYIGLASGY